MVKVDSVVSDEILHWHCRCHCHCCCCCSSSLIEVESLMLRQMISLLPCFQWPNSFVSSLVLHECDRHRWCHLVEVVSQADHDDAPSHSLPHTHNHESCSSCFDPVARQSRCGYCVIDDDAVRRRRRRRR